MAESSADRRVETAIIVLSDRLLIRHHVHRPEASDQPSSVFPRRQDEVCYNPNRTECQCGERSGARSSIGCGTLSQAHQPRFRRRSENYHQSTTCRHRESFIEILVRTVLTASQHPSSINFRTPKSEFGTSYLTYFTILQSKKLYAWETGPVDDKALALLCGDQVDLRVRRVSTRRFDLVSSIDDRSSYRPCLCRSTGRFDIRSIRKRHWLSNTCESSSPLLWLSD